MRNWEDETLSFQEVLQSRQIIYGAARPWSRQEYVGETSVGFHTRAMQHMTSALQRQGRQRFHDVILSHGTSTFIWYPLAVLPPRSSKRHRLLAEGGYIWERCPSLNDMGRETRGVQLFRAGIYTIMGRRPNNRPLLRLRRKFMMGRHTIGAAVPPRLQGRTERSRCIALLSIVIRMSRRPWPVLAGFNNLVTVRAVRQSSIRQVQRLVLLADRVLDPVPRNIFWCNFRRIMANKTQIIFTSLHLRSPLFILPKTSQALRKALKRTAAVLQAQGVLIIIYAKFSSSRMRGAMEIFDNTNKWSRTLISRLPCNCARLACHGFRTLEGHICQPLDQWLRPRLPHAPHPAWTIRSRCTPDFPLHLQSLEKHLISFNKRIIHRLRQAQNRGDTFRVNLGHIHRCIHQFRVIPRWDGVAQSLNHWARRHSNAFSETAILQYTRLFRQLVICPMDHEMGDGLVVCPMKYGEAICKMSSGLRLVSPFRLLQILDGFYRVGKLFHDLPFCRLSRASNHKFGALRVWPKRRTLDPWPATWSSIKWRPLVSYISHHWRFLLSLAGKCCTAAIRILGIGWGVESPRSVVEALHLYNRCKRPGERRLAPTTISMHMYDIENFFVNVSPAELQEAVQKTVQALRRKDPSWRYFCVTKIPQQQGNPYLHQQARLGAWRILSGQSFKCRQFFSHHKNKEWTCLHLQDWMTALSIDTYLSVTNVLGKPFQSPGGLNIGSPIAAGGASLVVAWREYALWCSLDNWIQQEFMSKVFVRRWMDDLLLIHHLTLSPQLRLVILKLTAPYFYGPTLLLKQSTGSESFGFRLSVSNGGTIAVRPILKLSVAAEAYSPSSTIRRATIHGGHQFRGPAVEFAVAVGHYIRYLDMTNMPRFHVISGLLRLSIALLDAGFATKTIKRAMKRAKAVAGCDLQPVELALRWSPSDLQKWRAVYDRQEAARHLHMLLVHVSSLRA